MPRSKLLRLGSVALALLVWQLTSLAVGQRVLLVGPLDVARELAQLLPQAVFWQTVWFSFQRILAGFLLALAGGALLAALSYCLPAVELLLWPYVAVIKSTPVASMIILVLIWLNAASLSVFVTFLIVFPVVYANLLQGLQSTDRNLLEMLQVFQVGWWRRLRHVYLPQLKPYLTSACSASLGMAWKAGTAAEVIGIPRGSIGERLYEAKIYLSTAELLAWTVVIILLSVAFERLFIKGLELCYERLWKS